MPPLWEVKLKSPWHMGIGLPLHLWWQTSRYQTAPGPWPMAPTVWAKRSLSLVMWSHLKIELGSGEPGVWRLRPKLTQLHLARSRLLSASILLLL